MNDSVGAKTLDIMAQARNYNNWLFGQIRPWLTSPVAEVGAGTGTFSRLLSDSGLTVTAIDKNSQYLASIRGISTIKANLENPLPKSLHHKFSSVIALNVVEHIVHDTQALANIYALLRPSGRLVVLVPAHMWAYGSLDKNLGHVRRYNSRQLVQLLISAGFTVTRLRYLNILGLIGWWINGKILRRSVIPRAQLQVFDYVAYPFLLLEKYFPLPGGLSLLAVAQKP